MMVSILFAAIAGVLISLSRQLNGRLSLTTTALVASFWNHIVGFAVLTILGLAYGELSRPGVFEAPLYAFFGGALGVIFVASGSWLIARIGATATAILIIAGQMGTGLILDILHGTEMSYSFTGLGLTMILGGVALIQRKETEVK
ncbi:DMT family transporter [Agrobacterium vitis]|uniref:DMT family transporter n=1 Tax=Agrobacterium vitis TaxID=373 RepID=UPI0012E75FDA|nr:DMT family transporter [Agrobacterium vitis]MVA25688.1 EamA-like transporter family protein [Agrobacterium vitis]